EVFGIPNWASFLLFFKQPVYRLGDRSLSLDNIEHDILRAQYKESRIHFALVCAATGCPLLRAEAYTLYGSGLRSLSVSEREGYFRRAMTYFKGLENFRRVSKIHYDIFYMHQADLSYDQLRQTLDTTIFYCYEGLARDQDTYYTLAKAYQWQSKYLKKLGRLDEAMKAVEKGFSQEMRYWQRSERDKAIEAYRVHENEKTEQRLLEQNRLLSIAEKRTLGLTVFTVLILLLSFVTLYIYNQLKKSNERTELQAVELDKLNGKLATSNAQLEKSLQHQIILKAELKHRVKNNLQLILGLFRRQEKSIADPTLQDILKQGKEQVQSIALLHQKMDVKDTTGTFDPQSYLTEMMTNIAKSYVSIYPEVKLHLDLNVDLIHVDAAVPLGLITNELVTNAYKYAFPDGGSGNIWVTFSKLPDHFYLRIADDGVGLPDDITERREGGLGTQLIKGLVRQLDGTVAWIEADTGTVVQIQFRGYLSEEEI
ncbi:MAG: histidine kinase dimerization/phosphoacceptor domain -containing protein, partial [Bacteroidota bacterium]